MIKKPQKKTLNFFVKLNSMAAVQENIERQVLTDVVKHGETSRTEISERTGLSKSTVSRALRTLLERGLLSEYAQASNVPARGRPIKQVATNPTLALVAGIDLGVMTTRIIVCNAKGELQSKIQVPTQKNGSSAIWSGAWTELKKISPHFGDNPLDQCSVAVPGAVAGTPPTISNAPNLPGIEGTEFIREATLSLKNRVLIDNDVNLGLTAELIVGRAKEVGSASMVTIGSGLGTAISINRRILRGERGLVGEFGQLSVGQDGRKLEDSIKGRDLLELADSLSLEIDAPGDLLSLPAKLAGPALYSFHSALITVLTALTVASDPEVIVVGGGTGERLRDNFAGYMSTITKSLGYAPTIVASELGEFGPAIGASIFGVSELWKAIGVSVDDSLDSLSSPGCRLLSGIID